MIGKKISFCICLTASLCCLLSCEKNKNEFLNTEVIPEKIDIQKAEPSEPLDSFFKLDYTKEFPEEEKSAVTLSLDGPVVSKDTKDVSIIPGIRELSSYIINYINHLDPKKAHPPIINPNKDAFEQKDGDLVVAAWGPQEKIPSEVKKPSFYVIFSEPVMPVSALKRTPDTTSTIMSISPPIKGVFKWYGTRQISFEAQETINPLVKYTITIKKGTTSLTGKKLQKDFTYTTYSEPLSITHMECGYSLAKEKKIYIDREDVIPEAANEVALSFNYPVNILVMKPLINVLINDKELRTFTLKTIDEDTVLLTLDGKIPLNTQVTIKIQQPIIDNIDYTLTTSYHTLSPFVFREYKTQKSFGQYLNPVYVFFSHDIDKTTVLESISTEPSMPITEDNLEIWNSTILIHGLPVTFDSNYTIKINNTLKDVYGQSLNSKKGDTNLKVHVPEAASFVKYLDHGLKMLESQFTPKLLIEYQNVLDGTKYTIVKENDPLNHYFGWKDSLDNTLSPFELNTKTKNTRLFEQIPLDPYLTNGKGWISLDSVARVASPYEDGKIYTDNHYMTVQVTDLGITTRYGINKAVVLVTSLKTGLPIENASVFLFGKKDFIPEEGNEELSFAHSTTNEQGLAILDFKDLQVAKQFFDNNTPAILVRYKDDKAVYEPQGHNPWSNGIYNTEYTENAADIHERTFMFTDRGLYQPGETVTYRGIDRNQRFGNFTPYTGEYTVTVKETTWNNPKILFTTVNETSASGGFWDSFDLPKDLEPGTYTISYSREKDSEEQNLYFTVAYFQRLKYQTAITLPQSLVVTGTTLTGTLKASYLSGGGLSNAKYEGSWFKEPYRFTSSDVTLKNYTFGPAKTRENRQQISSFEGTLSTTGEATLSCKTEASGLTSVPYRYITECQVTDTSNQLIATSKDIIVHPASCYIGLSKPLNTSGFPKKNTAIQFKYIMTDIDGSPLINSTKTGSNLKVELLHTTWKIVQQRGSQGSIYSSYKQEVTTEDTQTIQTKLADTFIIKPKNAGYYTVRLSGMDSDGHEICTEYEFYVTGSGYSYWNRYNAYSLGLTADQNMYNPGDTAQILLESPLSAGDYLITVEREGIYTEEVRHFDESCAVFDIPIARNYVPVVYVSICSYSTRTKEPDFEYGEEDTDKPKGYYGVTTLNINPRVKAFSVDIVSSKPSYLPGTEASITLRATKGGKPLANAELTLIAVDRGVLDLINYHVPNPIDFFYSKYNFPLCCYGGDSRSLLMDPVTYEIKNLQGGDGSDDEKDDERKDFNPTAVFLPELITDKNGEVTATFTLPDTLTTYRVTAFGVQDELLALQESEIAVQNPVNVTSVMPPRLRERDTAEAGVLLYNLDNKSHKMTVTASIRSPDSSTGNAFIDGQNTHTITIASGQNAVIYFDLAAKKAGNIEVVFNVESEILTEKLVQAISIEKPYIKETFTTCGTINTKDTTATEGLVIPSFSEDGVGELTISLDATRLGPLSSAINYVFDYPYDCMEQQSAALFPLIAFEDYIDVFNLDSKVSNIRECVKSTFNTWNDVQLGDGGFPYWPSGEYANFFVSLRIAHIVALAKDRGYSDSEIAIDTNKLLSFLTSYINSHRKYIDDFDIIYFNYVQTLYNQDVSNDSLATYQKKYAKDIAAQALIGMTFLNNGDKEKAQECADKIRRYMRPTTRGVDITEAKTHHYSDFRYSIDDDYALAMQLIVQLDSEDEMVTKILYSLLERQKSGFWHNTLTTTRVLDAVYTLIQSRNLEKTNFYATAVLDENTIAKGSFEGLDAKPVTTTYPLSKKPISDLKMDTVLPLEFTKKGKGTLYYTASLSYALPEEMQTARDEGIGIKTVITDVKTGKIIEPENAESPIVNLIAGNTYSMEINLESGYDRTYLALRAPVPSGSEIVNTNFVTTPNKSDSIDEGDTYNSISAWDSYWYSYWYGGNWMSNQEIFDNEVRYFWDQYHKGSTKATFKFRATRRGIYPVPPVTAECMYEPEVFGRTKGYLFVIK
ncbi:MAG: hypothetical protein BKP49_09615 [Treponema sp. CETP13]|nr:MAG: hypothetical protein BKP49_09615 [Treponema sp. CETP13]